MSNPLNAQTEILKWSAGRPDWQRDALRRIAQKGTLAETDLDDLEVLCRKVHQAEKPGAPSLSVCPLESVHFPSAGGGQAAVSLVSLGNPKYVNRLPPSGKIAFGPSPGLTVIYGDNGAGKSGYARVLKKACRARGNAQDIRPDAFSKAPKGKPSMEFEFSIAGVVHKAVWQEGTPSDPRLSKVFVFDSASADHYLQQNNAASFTPFGLDILPKLARAADALDSRLSAEDASLEATNAAVSTSLTLPPGANGTAVGKAISSLSDQTSEKVLDGLAVLKPEDENRLRELRHALSSDANKASKESLAAADRLLGFAATVEQVEKCLRDAEVQRCRHAATAAKVAQVTADKFSAQSFAESRLAGTGEARWRAMWAAASEFSREAAYPNTPFPATENEAACVLCQRILDEETSERLRAFQKSVSDKSQEIAAKMQAEVEQLRKVVGALPRLSDGYSLLEADLFDVSDESRKQIELLVRALDERQSAVVAYFASGSLGELQPAKIASLEVLTSATARLKERAKTEAAAADPAGRQKLETERSELAAREWFVPKRQLAVEQVRRLTRIKRLEACRKDLKTAAITAKNSDLTEIFVTKAFQGQFATELEELGLKTLEVVLEEIGGKKGETKFGLKLAKNSDENLEMIASEGEKRCISLAAFLAELSQASDLSTLVFDDPVSSLDFHFRDAIAKRLALEATQRQVIVFTHDVCLLEELRSCAENQGSAAKFLWLEWDGGAPGRCMDGVPWDQKGPKERLDELDKLRSQINKSWNPVPNDANKREMRAAYSLLRAALERIVEKELLGDVVARYRSQIKTGLLNKLLAIKPADVNEAGRLLQKCHDVTGAHDPSTKGQSSIPTPTDLAADIQATGSLLTSIKAKMKPYSASQDNSAAAAP